MKSERFFRCLAVVALTALSLPAQASESIALVSRVNGPDGTKTSQLKQAIKRAAIKVLVGKNFSKVLQQTAGFQNCQDDACYQRGAHRLRVSRIIVIDTNILRQGILGVGSKCALQLQIRNERGIVIQQKDTQTACSSERLIEAFIELSLDLKPRNTQSPVAQKKTSNASFRACAATKAEALKALSHNISSQISDRFDAVARASAAGEEQSVSSKTTIESNVQLQNITWESKDDQPCAIQPYADLMNATLARLERINTCEERFPEDPQLKHRLVSACLSDIRMVSHMYPLFWVDMSEDQKQIAKKLSRLSAQLEELGGKILLQSIRVDGQLEGAKLLIDGLVQDFGVALPWSSGPINVEIKAPGLCPFKQEVLLSDKQQLVLKPDLSTQSFPQVRFDVRQKRAQLLVEGKRIQGNQTLEFKRCQGTIGYKASLPDGESETGQVDLKPGLNKTISVDILTQDERRALVRLAKAYERSGLLTGNYRIGYPFSSAVDSPSILQTFSVDYSQAAGAFRYGGGAAYGFGEKGVHLLEAFGQLTAQLTSLGKGPLYLSRSLALIPFLSVDLGFARHTFKTDGDRRGDFGGFLASSIIVRGHAGVMFAPNEKVALKLHLSHNLTMERPVSLNAGIAVKLP